MSKKALKLGAASILALGAGAAVVSKKNKRDEQRKVTKDIQESTARLIASIASSIFFIAIP